MNVHTISTTYKSEGGTVTVKSDTVQGDFSANGEYQIPAGAVDVEVDFPINKDLVIGWAFGCSKVTGSGTGTFNGLTIKTNSSGSPDQTFEVTPTNGIAWSSGDTTDNPITTDITKLYISNDGSIPGNFIARRLEDSTPTI